MSFDLIAALSLKIFAYDVVVCIIIILIQLQRFVTAQESTFNNSQIKFYDTTITLLY